MLAFTTIVARKKSQVDHKQKRDQVINAAECVGFDQYPIVCPVKRSAVLCETSKQVMRINPTATGIGFGQ
jgi:hypothetical protein